MQRKKERESKYVSHTEGFELVVNFFEYYRISNWKTPEHQHN